jgi:hypothetical protein
MAPKVRLSMQDKTLASDERYGSIVGAHRALSGWERDLNAALLPRDPVLAYWRAYATGYVAHALDTAMRALADVLESADTHLHDRRARIALDEISGRQTRR